MRNLDLLELKTTQINENLENCEKFALSSDFIYFVKFNYLFKYCLKTASSEPILEESLDNVVDLKYLFIEHKVCVTSGNKIYIVGLSGDNWGVVEFDGVIEAINWSPNEETVALVLEGGKVCTCTLDYENFEKFSQWDSDLGAKIPDTVYVGWGSRFTQFRGSEGKSKDNKVVAKEIKVTTPQITWRGNGEMFAINYWKEKRRHFVVFETPCKALYHSEDTPNLGVVLSWRPTGNMIVGIIENNIKNLIIFEKNGQKRFNFPLEIDEDEIKSIKWSPCGTILTVETPNSLALLTTSNYKWYIKQSLNFHPQNPLLYYEWVETTQFTYTLEVVTQSTLLLYTFKTTPHRFDDKCAVINGNNLKITNFRKNIIPPILSECEINVQNKINFVNLFKNRVAILDNFNKLFTFDEGGNLINESDLKLGQYPLNLNHLYLRDDFVLFMNNRNLQVSKFDGTNNLVPCNSNNFLLINNEIKSDNLLMEINDVRVVRVNNNSGVYFDYCYVNNEFYNLALTNSNCFLINGMKISDAVSSFLIFDNYLLLTTKLNELFCVRLNDLNTLLNKTLTSTIFYKRNIEQGAILICGLKNTPNVILQLPRGNLETISCSFISIDILDNLLEQGNWEEALYFIKTEKLNYNLLIDLNSERFLKNISQFIDAIKTKNELNNIMLEIESENLLETIYKNCTSNTSKLPDKIRVVFEKIINYFEGIDYAPYITALVLICYQHFTLNKALTYLQDLLNRGEEDLVKTCVSLLKNYNVNEEKLYEEALLLYDLNFARFIVRNTQIDPRIFEPQLKKFESYTPIEQRFEICKFLNKHNTGVKYLIRFCNDTAKLENYIRGNKVSAEAYQSCSIKHKNYPLVTKLFAESLSLQGLHFEAGVVLKRAKLFGEALREFKLGLCWREVINLVNILNYNDDEKFRIISEVAEGLLKQKQTRVAADLFENYVKNYEKAFKIYLENCCFNEALHLAYKYKYEIKDEIVPAILNYALYLNEKLSDLQGTFDKHKNRLKVIRDGRRNQYEHPYDLGDDGDLFSDAGSIVSKSSRSSRSKSSTLSSRNRRKEERKKQDLREGGQYEDIALVRALYILIKEIYDKNDELNNICCLLLSETDEKLEDVRKLYNKYREILDGVERSLGEIWPNHFYYNNPTQNVGERADIENIEHLDKEFRVPPKFIKHSTLHIFL